MMIPLFGGPSDWGNSMNQNAYTQNTRYAQNQQINLANRQLQTQMETSQQTANISVGNAYKEMTDKIRL
jgi:hypothetical protein